MFLDSRHLRSLLAIRQTGNMSRAAERLHITPSALSHQVKSLERYFGVTLFHRHRKPLCLTHAGQLLVTYAERITPLLQQAEADLKRLAEGDAGRLFIVLECHACFDWLMPVLGEFRAAWPEIELDIRLDFDALPALRCGDIDLVITSDPVAEKGLRFDPLFDYRALLILAEQHPLTGKSWIAPEDLAGETLLTYPVDRKRLDIFRHFLQPAGVEPAAVRPVELTSLLLLLAASGRGVTALPDWVWREATATGLTSRPLGRNGLRGTLYAATRQADHPAGHLDSFIGLTREFHTEGP